MIKRLLPAAAALFACAIAPSAIPTSARAEIAKTAMADCHDNKICFYWWPKLPAIPGWHTDDDANFRYGTNGINSLVLDGATFATSDAVIYGAAIYQPRYEAENPRSRTLADFIRDDRETFSAEHRGIVISEVAAPTTADGQALKSYTYVQPQDGLWERVSYGQEEDFYLVFTLSARSEAAYRAALPAYEALIARYRK